MLASVTWQFAIYRKQGASRPSRVHSITGTDLWRALRLRVWALSVSLLFQKPFRFQCSHAAGPGRGDGLAIAADFEIPASGNAPHAGEKQILCHKITNPYGSHEAIDTA